MGTPTANKGLIVPTLNGDFGVWGSELNGDLNTLDLNLGGSQSIAMSSTNVVATATQAQYLITAFTGTLTANVSYTLPPAGGLFVFANKTIGAFTVTVMCAGGGSSIVIPQGTTIPVVCDGINVTSAASAYILNAPGGTVQMTNLNLTGSATGAGGFISTGTDSGGLNFRATDASYGAGLLLNSNFAYLLSTSAGSPLGAYNAYRPLYWNMATGAVELDATGAGISTGGSVSVAGTLTAGSAITASGNVTGAGFVTQKNGGIYGYDSAGTLRLISGIGGDNYTNVFNAGGQGWRVLNQSGTAQLFLVDPAGNASSIGRFTCAAIATGNVNSTSGFSAPTGYCEAASFQGPAGTMNVHGSLYCDSTAAFIGGVYMASSLGVAGPLFANGTLAAASELYGASNIRSAKGYTCLNGPNSGVYGSLFNIWWGAPGLGYLYIDNTAIGWQAVPSDRAYKQDITPLSYNGLEKLLQLTPVSYRFNGVNPLFTDDGKTRDGLVAQDVQEVLPSAVNDAVNEHSPMTLDLMPLVTLLIKSVQELSVKLDTALARISVLEARA